jgi:hypothetical protein
MLGLHAKPSGEKTSDHPGQSGTLRVLIGLAGPAVLAIIAYAATEDSWEIFAVSTLVAACAFALGSLLGFLFGIPQYLAKAEADTDKASYQPNTNLTQVSDWLTKIIIGVGLVEFGQLATWIGELGDDLEPSLGGDPTGKSIGVALVVGFFVIGFLVGYLYTRLRLQAAFTQSDRGAFEVLVDAKLKEKNEADAQALKLASQQLDPMAKAPPPDELKEALNEASPPIKEQVLSQARSLEKQPAGEAALDRARVVTEAIDDPAER